MTKSLWDFLRMGDFSRQMMPLLTELVISTKRKTTNMPQRWHLGLFSREIRFGVSG